MKKLILVAIMFVGLVNVQAQGIDKIFVTGHSTYIDSVNVVVAMNGVVIFQKDTHFYYVKADYYYDGLYQGWKQVETSDNFLDSPQLFMNTVKVREYIMPKKVFNPNLEYEYVHSRTYYNAVKMEKAGGIVIGASILPTLAGIIMMTKGTEDYHGYSMHKDIYYWGAGMICAGVTGIITGLTIDLVGHAIKKHHKTKIKRVKQLKY